MRSRKNTENLIDYNFENNNEITGRQQPDPPPPLDPRLIAGAYMGMGMYITYARRTNETD